MTKPTKQIEKLREKIEEVVFKWHEAYGGKEMRELESQLLTLLSQEISKAERRMVGEIKEYIKNNYLHIRKCPDCDFESADHLKCQNRRCKSLSRYGSKHLLPTKKKADQALDDIINQLKEE